MTASRKQRPRQRRLVEKTAYGRSIIQKNMPQKGRWQDLYHWLLTSQRTSFGLTILGTYLGVNALFALAFMLVRGVDNMRPGSYMDAFFFSVQTMATIGYGRMVPLSFAANALVTVEAGLGLFFMAVAASLMFARFTRATAGVRFSEHVAITKFEAKPTLMFRIANQRLARITEANIYLVVARQQKTAEGQDYRRLIDLQPVRSFTPVFELSWTVTHVIDETSPLWGLSQDDMADAETAITAIFTGHHEGLQQRVHARHTYTAESLMWDHRFTDMFVRDETGGVVIDYAHFDQLTPVPPKDRLDTLKSTIHP